MSAGDVGLVCETINMLFAVGETFKATDLTHLLATEIPDNRQVGSLCVKLAQSREDGIGSGTGYVDPPLEKVSPGYFRVRRHHVPTYDRDGADIRPLRPACPACHFELNALGECGWC